MNNIDAASLKYPLHFFVTGTKEIPIMQLRFIGYTAINQVKVNRTTQLAINFNKRTSYQPFFISALVQADVHL